MRKCIVIPDSFKGSMSSIEICDIAERSIHRFFPDCEVITVPAADGGEGTVECFMHALGGEKITETVTGPLGEKLTASYAVIGSRAFIEMAAASGLPLVGDRRDPMITTTYGTGEQIKSAIDRGASEIVLGLGGSATNDGGCGCAAALGVRFTDKSGRAFIPTGGTLKDIAHIDVSRYRELLSGVKITAMCDIDNPLYGKNGAAYVFGPQKGADENTVRLLDDGLMHLAKLISSDLGADVASIPGAGAAGGFGAGCVAFLGAELLPGIETVLNTVDFDTLLSGCDAVFTGEGKIDSQSLRGKVVIGVARRAKAKNVPVIAVVGDVADDAYDAYSMGVTAMFSINRLAIPYSEARLRSKADFEHTFEDILRLIGTSGSVR